MRRALTECTSERMIASLSSKWQPWTVGVWRLAKTNGVLEASLSELDQDAFDTHGLARGRPDVAKRGHMSCSLNSLKGGYIGDYLWDYYRGY